MIQIDRELAEKILERLEASRHEFSMKPVDIQRLFQSERVDLLQIIRQLEVAIREQPRNYISNPQCREAFEDFCSAFTDCIGIVTDAEQAAFSETLVSLTMEIRGLKQTELARMEEEEP